MCSSDLTQNLEDASELCGELMEMRDKGIVTVFFNTDRLAVEGGYQELNFRIESYEEDDCGIALIFIPNKDSQSDYVRIILNCSSHIPVILGARGIKENEEIIDEVKDIFFKKEK